MKKPPDLDGFFVDNLALITRNTQSFTDFLNADDAELMDFVARRFIVQIHSAFKPIFVIIVIVFY